MEIILIAVLLGLVPAFIASSKGKSFAAWWIYGTLLFIVAIIHALVLKPDDEHVRAKQRAAGMKQCPYCAEMIRGEAVLCRYCNQEVAVNRSDVEKAREPGGSPAAQDGLPLSRRSVVLGGGLILAMVAIGILAVYEISNGSGAVANNESTNSDTESTKVVKPSPRATQVARRAPVEVTIIAQDEPLESFRVKVDDDARRPYWIEPGAEETFTAQDQVTIWGEGGSATPEEEFGVSQNFVIRVGGYEWDPPDGRVLRIDEARWKALVDSLAGAEAVSASP